MGLLDFLTPPRPSNRVITIDSSLGNVLMAGKSDKGMEMIMTNYAIDSINKDGGVIIFRDVNNGFEANPSITTANSRIFQINNEEFALTRQFDPFSIFSDEQISACMVDMFNNYEEIDKSKRISYQNYIKLMLKLLKLSGKKPKFNELVDYGYEELDRLNSILPLPETERNRNEKFLNAFLPDVPALEAYFSVFSQNTIGEILSGSQTLEKIFLTKDIIEISLDFDTKPAESEMLMSLIVDNICKINPASAKRAFLTVIANEVPNEVLIKTKFHKIIKAKKDLRTVYTVTDLSNLVEQSNEWIEYANSYFFFKQNSNKNKDLCSNFFGTYEKTKESRTEGVNRPTFWSAISGNNTATTKQTTKTYTKEKEAVYLPDVFASLPENEAICFFKDSNEHLRLTVY